MATQQAVDIKTLSSIVSDTDIMSGPGYLRAVEQGVSGAKLKKLVKLVDDRDVFARVIGKDKSNLSKSYRVKQLPKLVGDNVLDTVRIYILALEVYGSFDIANEWLHSPIPALGGKAATELLDTHAGRALVRETLRKIQFGEYS